MSTKKLFITRLIQECRYQWEVIRTVVDMVICIYLIVPLLFIGISVYREAWQDISLYWQAYYPLTGLILLILLLSSGGNFRTFLFEADLLYFIQQKKILYFLKIYSFFFSLILVLLQVIILLVLALPVLKLVYHFSYQEIGLLFLMVSAYKLMMMLIRKNIKRLLYRRLLSIFFYIGAAFFIVQFPAILYGFIGMVLLMTVLIFQLQAAKNNHQFYQEIEIENKERHKYIGFFIGLSVFSGSPVEFEKISTYQRKKPLFLWKGSKRILKKRNDENGLLEFCLKAFVRNRNYLLLYFQVTSMTSALLFILPLWLKVIIYFIFMLFIRSWMKEIYVKITKHPFFQVIDVNKETMNTTQRRFQQWTTLPAIILLGFLLLLSLFFG